ncbi:hypothetical protein [Haloarchaeobius sp. FL176]|uniref:hypothetical protein n=1 Tax=Haloarchaeobius sp. FL176 TaxID=2967129 RepID=UPI00214993F9|nr:hypothetical protein [Haloarchaeobius sp. FL176]
MSDAALRRTLRRCTALLLIPLSLRVVQFRNFHAENGVDWRLMPELFTSTLPWFVILAAAAYLVGSVLAAFVPENPPTAGTD